jgi:hypothetical protein
MSKKSKNPEQTTTSADISALICRLEENLKSALGRLPLLREEYVAALANQAQGLEGTDPESIRGALVELQRTAKRLALTVRGLRTRHEEARRAEEKYARAQRRIADGKRLDELIAQLEGAVEFSRDLEADIRMLAASTGRKLEIEPIIKQARDRCDRAPWQGFAQEVTK